LIEAAKQLEEAATNLYQVAQSSSSTPQQFLESAKSAATKALALVEKAEQAMKIEKDSVKKELLRDAIFELRDASQKVLVSAKEYRKNPCQTTKAKFEAEYQRLEQAIRKVVGLNSGEIYDDTPKEKLRACLDALESASTNLIRNCSTNPEETDTDVQVLSAIALQLAKQAESYANSVSDPEKKKENPCRSC